jgi:REP element-mobilizing transposase RayT
MPVRRLKGQKGPALVYVTTTCIDWLPIFSDREAAKCIARQLGETAKAMNTAIVAYVVMPTHMHALLGFPDVKELSNFMQTFKSLSSRSIKALDFRNFKNFLHKNGMFSLWKRGFDDLIIFSEEQFWTKLTYIHENPVRAGLVEKATDWEFSSAKDWALGENGLSTIDKTFFKRQR